MSGIAGIIHFDGRPVEPGQVEAMTAAMHYRGPDGINHWRRGNVALGQCMLRTTPESLEEIQPLTNEDESLVLVMDGRVDNFEELRRELMGKGAVLRTRADAELVLRAYEVWGEDCPDRIIGECVFFIWDARQQRLFAARDASGTRHFYYYQGKDWFAFSSEIKGLLALPGVERRLNESRLLDYLVEEFDRNDEVGTLYQGILRMPAGNAMSVTAAGPRIWRWWNPGKLIERKIASLQECAEAFMEQFRVVVKCRLRSIKPVGAMLSGGLDSSTIVGLISKEFRSDLHEPLSTFSLIRQDRENCPDWHGIQAIVQADTWIRPTIITSGAVDFKAWQKVLSCVPQADEPFGLINSLSGPVFLDAVTEAGCGVVLEGTAGDLLFYGASRTATEIVSRRRFDMIPAFLAAYRNHRHEGVLRDLSRAVLGNLAPEIFRAGVRRRRDERRLSEGELNIVHPNIARAYLASKRSTAFLAGDRMQAKSDQMGHAGWFTSGMISFPHEVGGAQALNKGIELRSPFSDRRMIEFSIQMPLEYKITASWYKNILRIGTDGLLPDSVRWRRNTGGHPGWVFYEQLVRNVVRGTPSVCSDLSNYERLDRWVQLSRVRELWGQFQNHGDYESGRRALCVLLLSKWLASRSGMVVC